MHYEKEKYKLRQRKSNGIFYVVTGSGGNTERISTRTAERAEAEQFRAQFIEGLKNAPPPPNPIVRILLDRYEQQRGPKTRSPDTIKYHRKHLDKYFGDLQPQHISNRTLENYADERRRQGKRRGNDIIKEPISDGTVLREIGTLRAALRFAANERWIPSMMELEAPVPKPPPCDLWLTKTEVRKLIACAKSPHIKLFILAALSTAARSGAILDLKWEGVDFERMLINYGRGHGNKKRTVAPMNKGLFEALAQAHKAKRSDWVIEIYGRRIKSVKGAFRRLTIECGIDATPHVLRHTAATWLVMDGVPIAEIARLLGDSEKTVEKVYGKHSPTYLKRAVDALDLSD